GDLSDSVYNQSWGNWNQYTYQFTATSSLSTLTFTSLDGGRDTTGNIFDDVKVTAVSEPGTIALFALGLAGLVATRKKMK
ncbi:PEP-CTERM sorting domain-containing protein, partial [Oleiphilus sp. HI0123]